MRVMGEPAYRLLDLLSDMGGYNEYWWMYLHARYSNLLSHILK